MVVKVEAVMEVSWEGEAMEASEASQYRVLAVLLHF